MATENAPTKSLPDIFDLTSRNAMFELQHVLEHDLNNREGTIMEYRLAQDGSYEYSIAETAEAFRTTTNEVIKIESKVIERLKLRGVRLKQEVA